MVIAELKGSMAHLSKEEDKELKRTDLRNLDIRRDFSVIHSRQMKKNHLFLGPARFVNVSHDSFPQCVLMTLLYSMIARITANYFGKGNTSLSVCSVLSPLAKK